MRSPLPLLYASVCSTLSPCLGTQRHSLGGFAARRMAGLSVLGILLLMPVRSMAQDCLDCHGDASMLEPVTAGRTKDSLVVAKDALKGSVHEDLSCSDCHAMDAGEGTTAHYDKGGKAPTLACANCHEQAQKDYDSRDIHGKRMAEHNPHAPNCVNCHGGHSILPLKDPRSPLSPHNQPDTCGKCHQSEDLTDAPGIAKRKLIERYHSSIHWKRLEEGRPAASCSDCHGHHTILPTSDPQSSVTRTEQIKTCGKCHGTIATEFSTGSHGSALLAGNLDVPSCTTCHGDHDMTSLKTQKTGQRDLAAVAICIWCHGNKRMMERYALDTAPVESYMSDFHGMAQRGSLGAVATCADCHEAHYCLPSGHERSRMHISNRGAACGECHGESSDTFVMSFTHKKAAKEPQWVVVKWVTVIYVVLILVTIGGMLLHNSIIWTYFVRRKYRYQKKRGVVVRMSAFERFWHWAMLIAFILLAVTGFALSFSETAAVKWVYELGFTESARAFIHRLFAVVLIVDSLLFGWMMLFTRSGRRKWLWGMMPRWQDFKDFHGTMAYHLFSRKEKPRFAIFNYAEKAEFWALWWGTAVMALSGLVLWFSVELPADAPKWLVPVAKVVHYYEAVLAVLSIIVWHFFHTVFHPEEYPLGTSFLTGRLSPEEAEERFTHEAVAEQTVSPEVEQVEAPHKPKWSE